MNICLEMMNLPELSAQAAKLRKTRPLVHCITNYVTAADTANMLLAAGAAAVMADDPAESAQITASADALLVNLGTPSQSRIEAMLRSCAAAKQKGIPVVLDPVAVGASALRKEAAEQILASGAVTIVRGNLSEISALAGFSGECRGVEAGDTRESAADVALAAAEKLRCTVTVTGARDVICQDGRIITLANGTPLLKQVTGAGCMTSALTAAFAAVSEPFSAAVLGAAFMGVIGEQAAQLSRGRLGSFRVSLFDAAGELSGKTLCERIRYEEN